MKAEGALAGVWDAECPFDGVWEGEPKSALHIEMKAPGGRLTEAQEAFRYALQHERAFVVCTDWVAAAFAICVYLEITDRAIWEGLR